MRLLLVLPLLLCGQTFSTSGSIHGRITDRTGTPVMGAAVVARQEGSGQQRQTASDAAGEFRIPGAAIGAYTLRIEKEGFAPAESVEFAVSVGQTVRHEIRLELARVVEKLEVTDRPEAIEASATTAGAALGGERIEESPATNRNYLNFVLVAPGVTPSSGSNSQRNFAGTRHAVSDSGFTFNGLRGRNNSLQVDGMDNRDETTGGVRVGIGLEMVQEFRVTSTAGSAEFGGAAGGLVNVVTRSGTNLWHGDFTFFSQTGRLNARNPEVASAEDPGGRRLQPGASINGPVRKDSTFFSTAWEQQWDRGSEWSNAPAEWLDRINSRLVNRAKLRRGLYGVSSSGREFSIKLNHQAGSRHSISSRYAYSSEQDRNDVQGAENFSDVSSRGSSQTGDHSWVGSWTTVFGPRWIHELRGQIARREVRLVPNAAGAMLEIPGVVSLGQAYRLDGDRTEDHYQTANTVSWTGGRYQVTGGFSFHAVDLDARLANRFSGIFVFPTVEDFLLARPDVFAQAYGEPRTKLTTYPVGWFVQQRWQPADWLTVEGGVRLDHQKMPDGIPNAGWNVSPRMGVAIRPWPKAPYVIRASAGLFYDRYPLAFLNDAVQKNGRQGYEQYLTGEDAARVFRLTLGGPLTSPLAGHAVSRYAAAERFPAARSQKFAAGLERGFGKDTTLTAEYAWVRGLHLPRIRNAALRLAPLYQLEQEAQSAHHGLSINLNRRMSRELTFLFAYQTGQTRDDGSDFDEHPSNPGNARLDWALSRQHQAHRLAASALFELPDVTEALENFVVAPIVTWNGARPLNALLTTDTGRTGAYPISARPAGTARNSFSAAGGFAMHLRLLKGFPVKEGRAIMQVGVEAFNLTNHSNPLRASPWHASPAGRLGSFGEALEMLEARQVQFVMQFEY